MAVTKSEPWYVRTLDLVKRRHEPRLDKVGRPYYQHFERVADRLLQAVPDATPAQVQAALLHDALEPGEMSPSELRDNGIDDETIRIIQAITLPTDGRDYLQYINDLAATRDVYAIQVKLADNADAIANYQADASDAAKEMLERRFLPSRQILLQAVA
ncbi:MAG: hypothetical protein JO264_07025 [Acidisphaera sp.]|nr:hypothetical protein [Acidisphaera sp.]